MCIEDCPWLEHEEEFEWPVYIDSRGDDLSIVTTKGDRIVRGIYLVYKVQKAETRGVAHSVKRYSSMSKTLMDQISYTADLSGTKVGMEFYGRVSNSLPKMKGMK
jgi:hypothetical protein